MTLVVMIHAHVETQANVFNHIDILNEERTERGESSTIERPNWNGTFTNSEY